MAANRYWSENDGCYELHFRKYDTDEVVLKFAKDGEDQRCVWYCSDDLNVHQECEFFDSIDEAKEWFEETYSENG